MPLSAQVNGEPVIGAFLPEDRWQAIDALAKASPEAVLVTCCGKQAYPREAPGVVRHFVHREHDPKCPYKPEAPVQLLAKLVIARACIDAGYETTTDVWGSDWCTDVLAMRPTSARSVAFQVQWKRIALARAVEKQQQYSRDGVRACWLFKKLPARHHDREDFPAFVIRPGGEDLVVEIGTRTVPLSTGITDLLSKRVRFVQDVVAKAEQKAEVVLFELPCAHCPHENLLYDAFPEADKITGVSHCGLAVEGARGLIKSIFAPEIRNAVENYLREHPALPPLAEIRENVPSRPGTPIFFCQGCKRFGYNVGLYPRIAENKRPDRVLAKFSAVAPFGTRASERRPHWCYPADGTFCHPVG